MKTVRAGCFNGNGRKCAIGFLIADELYRPEIEGIGISYYRHAKDGSLLRALYASEVNAYDPEIVELLIELEEMHNDFSVDEWPQLLARVDERHAFIYARVKARRTPDGPGESPSRPRQNTQPKRRKTRSTGS